MWITGRETPEEAYEEIYTLNDGPPVSSRKAILELFDAEPGARLKRTDACGRSTRADITH